MRLKVSPKAAVQAIDVLVKAGTNMAQLLRSVYEQLDKDIEAEHEEYVTGAEEKRQRAIKAAQSQPENLEIAMPDGSKVSIPNPARPIASLAVIEALMPSVPSMPSFLGGDGFVSKIAEPRMDELEQRYADWRDETKELLEGIFMDFTPVHTFMDARGEFYSETSPFGRSWRFEKYINVTRTLDAKIAILIGFYEALSDGIRSPLTYLPDQAKICFYDFVCPLTADTNESLLCGFMFGFSIGEKVEMEDIFAGAFHGNKEDFCGKDRETIKNAYDGINRKTNDVFGFPILKKDGTTLCLTLPSRVAANLT